MPFATISNTFSVSTIEDGKDGNGIVSVVSEYAISAYGTTKDDKTPPAKILGEWSDNQPEPTNEHPYLWAKITTTFTQEETDVRYRLVAVRGEDGKDGKDGMDGENGAIGRMYYYAGEYNDEMQYRVTEYEAPYVSYVISGQTRYYVRIGYENPPKGTPPTDDRYWDIMSSDFKYIITQAIFSDFAKLGSAIFSNDWMFSQYGIESDGRLSYNYDKFNPLTDAFTPLIAIDFMKGYAHFGGGKVKCDVNGVEIEGNIRLENVLYTIKDDGVLSSDWGDFNIDVKNGTWFQYNYNDVYRIKMTQAFYMISEDPGYNVEYTIPKLNAGEFRVIKLVIVPTSATRIYNYVVIRVEDKESDIITYGQPGTKEAHEYETTKFLLINAIEYSNTQVYGEYRYFDIISYQKTENSTIWCIIPIGAK